MQKMHPDRKDPINCVLRSKLCRSESSLGSILSDGERFSVKNKIEVLSGCGAVGRVVAYTTRDLRFESIHQQFDLLSTVLTLR